MLFSIVGCLTDVYFVKALSNINFLALKIVWLLYQGSSLCAWSECWKNQGLSGPTLPKPTSGEVKMDKGMLV